MWVNNYNSHVSKFWSRIFNCFVLCACCTVKILRNTLENISYDIQPLHLLCCKSMKKKNRKKINILESLFFTWQTLTYDDTVVTYIPKVYNNTADQTERYSTQRFLWGNKVHSFDGVSWPYSRGNATCTKTQVTNTELDWQRIPAPPPAVSSHI